MTPILDFDGRGLTPLTYNKDTKTFSIEASELPDQIGVEIRSRSFRCFWVYFVKTGNRSLFTLSQTIQRNGDLMAWEYSGPAGFKLVVFND